MARSKNIDGHSPRLSGRDLQAYLAARIRSDHECSSLQEAIEKLRLVMSAMIREGKCSQKPPGSALPGNPLKRQAVHVHLGRQTPFGYT